jgi:hypothetical protein
MQARASVQTGSGLELSKERGYDTLIDNKGNIC